MLSFRLILLIGIWAVASSSYRWWCWRIVLSWRIPILVRSEIFFNDLVNAQILILIKACIVKENFNYSLSKVIVSVKFHGVLMKIYKHVNEVQLKRIKWIKSKISTLTSHLFLPRIVQKKKIWFVKKIYTWKIWLLLSFTQNTSQSVIFTKMSVIDSKISLCNLVWIINRLQYFKVIMPMPDPLPSGW